MIMAMIYKMISGSGTEPEMISYFAITILIITILFKLLTIPVTLSSIKTQKINEKMGPEMKEIQKKYKNDPQTQQRKIAELHQKHGFNPLAGCLPMIIQMVLIIALFGVMREPELYMFGGQNIDHIAKNFFWIKDLSNPDPYWFGLPLINGISQFLFASMTMPKAKPDDDNPMAGMGSTMRYMMPIMIFFFARQYTAGLALYWAFSNMIELLIRTIIKKTNNDDELVTQKG